MGKYIIAHVSRVEVNKMNGEDLLGKQARDKITGFEGIIIAKVTYLYGCNQYGLSPRVQDGKVIDSSFFDEGRIEIIGNGVCPGEVKVKKNGGINRDCPKGMIINTRL